MDFSKKLKMQCGQDPALAERMVLLEYPCLVGIWHWFPKCLTKSQPDCMYSFAPNRWRLPV